MTAAKQKTWEHTDSHDFKDVASYSGAHVEWQDKQVLNYKKK